MSMTMKLARSIALGLFLTLAGIASAFAQCSGQAGANTYCGNPTAGPALAGWKPFSAIPLPNIPGGTVLGNRGTIGGQAAPLTNPILGIPGTSTGQMGFAGSGSGTATVAAQAAAGTPMLLLPTGSGTLVSSGASPLSINTVTGQISIIGAAGEVLAGAGPAFTAAPVLGVPGSLQGSLGFAGASGGTATVQAQATAGSPTLLLPNTSGTLADGASAPLVLNAATGNLTCPTCVTSSGGGAITGTAPISVSAAGVVSINAPYTTLTADNGGIVYSGVTNLAILAHTATARLPLLSGAATTPQWGAYTLPASVTSGGIPYFSSTSAQGSSALLTLNEAIVGGGSGNPPTSFAGTSGGVAYFGAGGILQTSAALTLNQMILGGGAGASPTSFVGTSGGIPYFGTGGIVQTSAALGANQIVLGGGAGASPTVLSCGTSTTLLHGGTPPTCTQLAFADISSGALATNAQYLAGTASELVSSGVIYQGEVTITPAGTTQNFDFSTFINAQITLGSNITTMNVSNVTAGKAGQIRFIQDATGSRTVAFNSIFKFSGGTAPTLTTTAAAADALEFNCVSSTYCVATLIPNVK